MLCHACRDALRATTTLLLRQVQHAAVPTVQLLHYKLRQLQHAAVPAVLLLHYYYDNYNTLPCPPCYYYTNTTTNTSRCGARCATTTLLLRQLQNAVLPTVLLLHYCYYNYNALPCPRDARRANTTLLLRQLQHAAMFTMLLLQYYYDNYNTLPCLPCY